jgi:hypothetical protein
MGMNFQVGLFDHAWVFWLVLAGIVGIALLSVALARMRAWI